MAVLKSKNNNMKRNFKKTKRNGRVNKKMTKQRGGASKPIGGEPAKLRRPMKPLPNSKSGSNGKKTLVFDKSSYNGYGTVRVKPPPVPVRSYTVQDLVDVGVKPSLSANQLKKRQENMNARGKGVIARMKAMQVK